MDASWSHGGLIRLSWLIGDLVERERSVVMGCRAAEEMGRWLGRIFIYLRSYLLAIPRFRVFGGFVMGLGRLLLDVGMGVDFGSGDGGRVCWGGGWDGMGWDSFDVCEFGVGVWGFDFWLWGGGGDTVMGWRGEGLVGWVPGF